MLFNIACFEFYKKLYQTVGSLLGLTFLISYFVRWFFWVVSHRCSLENFYCSIWFFTECITISLTILLLINIWNGLRFFATLNRTVLFRFLYMYFIYAFLDMYCYICIFICITGTKTLSRRVEGLAFEILGFFFLSHCTACRTLVPPPGTEPMPPALEAWTLITGPPGKSQKEMLPLMATLLSTLICRTKHLDIGVLLGFW